MSENAIGKLINIITTHNCSQLKINNINNVDVETVQKGVRKVKTKNYLELVDLDIF